MNQHTAKQMLRDARESAKQTNRPGVARKGGVIVLAHRYEGPWQYEVGTEAMLVVTGYPKDVLPELERLLNEYA